MKDVSRNRYIEDIAKFMSCICDSGECFIGENRFVDCDMCYATRLYGAGYLKQEWISVEDRLPQNEEKCLIFTKIHFVPDHVDDCDYYYGVEISAFYKDRFLSNNGMYATHWMPLPEPPKTKGETE